ncbi:MAG: hypothetical protein A3I61_12720 [Acidobacteria bacterium RIFCSPLOWO2_02_FULL_68_18]|nr:MAG: hypothetical protein A3I61_12720 [Acidobacteria bacterium RIFCSPLOWO2_02_FULL_68_18]OFW48201.1 MAG: hypothetical protein A3G77_05060 [Acidobacteria bacterium RIFCSPLOWO2_12_FULL_68_19]
MRVTRESLIVELHDGRTVSVPVAWYPRLAHGSMKERQQWQLIGPGIGIHWPLLDEDISIDGLLRGLSSGESAESFERWLATRSRPANRRVQPAKAHRSSVAKRSARMRLRG